MGLWIDGTLFRALVYRRSGLQQFHLGIKSDVSVSFIKRVCLCASYLKWATLFVGYGSC